MGKTRDLFKKIRDTKGTFHAKMGLIKDRNGMDLTEAEDIKKRWQEYTEELYKKGLHDPDNHDDVITHLEPDILECEVKWALESITTNKASGGDGIGHLDIALALGAHLGGEAAVSRLRAEDGGVGDGDVTIAEVLDNGILHLGGRNADVALAGGDGGIGHIVAAHPGCICGLGAGGS